MAKGVASSTKWNASSSTEWNASRPAFSVSDLCALIGENWDCHGSTTSTGVLLELFKFPRNNVTLRRETCYSYLLLPGENTWPYQTRAVLYILGLFYCFVGLATIMKKFMEAMGNIVKQTRLVQRKDARSGHNVIREETIWNSTVADITLLALGSSFPQITLSVIDTVSNLGDPSAQGVGPGTLVGSAAFNLFAILAVIVLIPKGGTVKRVERIGVLIVEATWSIWAYAWLYIMVKVSSPNKVSLLEALLTVMQFPLLIIHAYAEDRNWPYISLSFWSKKVKRWISATGDFKLICAVSKKDDEGSPESGSEHSPREMQDVVSDHTRVSVSAGKCQAGEASAESPTIIALHEDMYSANVEDLKLSLGEKWRAELYYSMTVQGSTFEGGREVPPKISLLIKHAFTIFWRLVFAFIPPADVWHGWPAFVFALFSIAGLSAVLIQLANLFGCVTGISSYVIAITILASGTSWPDLIASKIAVRCGATADSGIANINCSNCINIFVGIGVPWLIEVCYNRIKLKAGFSTPTTGLSFSIIVYFVTFALCWIVVIARRRYLGGELGGPRIWAYLSSGCFTSLWLAFILLTCLKVYHVI